MTLTQITEKGIKDGEIVNADINASAAIAGSKISPSFTSDVTITGGQPALSFIDDGANPDYKFYNNNGVLRLYDITNTTDRLVINSDGHVDVTGNLDVGAGIDVTGALTVAGTAAQTGTFQSNQSATTISILDTDGDGLNISGGSAYGHRIQTNNTEKLELGVNSSTKLVLQNDGKTGIGTSSPAELLHLQSTAGNTKLRLTQSGSSTDALNGAIHFGNSTNGQLCEIRGYTSGSNDGGYLQFRTTSSGSGVNAITIGTTGNVGIGTASPGQKLEVRQTAASHAILAVNRPNSDTGALFLGNNSNNNALIASNNTDLIFGKDTSGTFEERMRMRLGGGLTFNGDTAAANALDDYEEGTWTPSLTFGGNSTGIGYGSRSGSYIKIGSMCYVQGQMDLTSKGSSTGDAAFASLPFTAGNYVSGTSQEGSGFISWWSNGAQSDFAPTTFWVSEGTTTATIYRTSNGADIQTQTNSQWANNTGVRFFAQYRTT